MTTTTKAIIGSRFEQITPLSFKISCHLENTTKVSCVLLDDKGRAVWEKNSVQNKGESNIEMQLPKLKPGNYNCWIEIDGQMNLRSLEIAGQNREKSMFSKLMNGFM